MGDSTKSLTDAGGDSERQFKTPEAKRAHMREYMAKRRKSKLVGMTVAEWEKAGCPKPDTSPSSTNLG